uniref:Succinate--CoA ligase [ADP-forming] subunit alpha n=1 Tax=Thermofilum pendens TaxID=2269 RepID=A0A7C1TB23_THEPE
MAILVDENTRVLVQGITGRQGSLHTLEMLKYGTRVVAGVTPGRQGERIHGVPVYNDVFSALEEHPEVNASIVFVPAAYAPDAVYEAIDAGIKLIVVITEHIPVHETLKLVRYGRSKGVTIVGPNTPGVISPGKCKVGIMPSSYFEAGRIGLMSRSGTLMYEVASMLRAEGFGVSTAVGIGGDMITGLNFEDVYSMFLRDDETDAVVLVGEIGGSKEERFANYFSELKPRKPVIAYIAGRSAPPGRRMGHAGAIVMGEIGTYASKVKSLEEAGIPVAKSIFDVSKLLSEALGEDRTRTPP